MPFVPVLRAEWTKVRTLRSLYGALLAVFAATIAFSAVAGVSDTSDPEFDPLFMALSGVTPGQIAADLLRRPGHVLRYHGHAMRISLAAVPRRGRWFAAKLAAVAHASASPWAWPSELAALMAALGRLGPGDDGGERAELVEHGQERLQQPVQREERVGQRHPAHHRAGDVALVPLVARQLAGHRGVAAQDHHQAVDALAGAGVHLVRHRRGADLTRLEALGDQLVPGHQPDRLGQRGGGRRHLHQRGDHLVVQRARVDLADGGERLPEAEVPRRSAAPAPRACPRHRRAGPACPGRCRPAP
ncbi:hypothetical protein SFUMM280S_08136 [Streptomyces fumanus]